MKVLVLGGYGLIGSSVMRALIAAGHDVTGLGRSARKGRAAVPDAAWIEADISRLLSPDDWRSRLSGFTAVVNTAGVLQDGLGDRVGAVQRDAMTALVTACEVAGVRNFVQISAPGAETGASTEFLRTKAEADRFLMASAMRWTVLRPGLVLSPQAYGGTALLRQLAAVPVVQPLVLAQARVQTVYVEDVAAAVVMALEKDIAGIDADLVAPETLTLESLVLRMRAWLGFEAPRAVWRLPRILGAGIGRFADLAGWLGWRSPLQTTALKVLGNGVTGNPATWPAQTGMRLRTLDETLKAMPATLQERIYARAMLAYPLLLLTLAAFWAASGLIGFARPVEAIAVLGDALPLPAAELAVYGGSLADCMIGAALLVRPLTRLACFAAIALSAAYLAGAAIFVPHLWLDPLGPMVKVIPAMALALVVAALSESR